MIDYFYDVDEKDAMFFYRATPLNEQSLSKIHCVLGILVLSGVEVGTAVRCKRTVKRLVAIKLYGEVGGII